MNVVTKRSYRPRPKRTTTADGPPLGHEIDESEFTRLLRLLDEPHRVEKSPNRNIVIESFHDRALLDDGRCVYVGLIKVTVFGRPCYGAYLVDEQLDNELFAKGQVLKFLSGLRFK